MDSQALTRLLRLNPVFQLRHVPPQVLRFSGVPAVAGTAVQMLMPIYGIKARFDQWIPRLPHGRIPFTL